MWGQRIYQVQRNIDHQSKGGFVTFAKHFKYLDSYISCSLWDDSDIGTCLASGNASMGALTKFWTDASVNNHSKYLIFLAIPINILLWGCERWSLCTSLLKKLEVFLHLIIRRILGISKAGVKEQGITNETIRKKFFDIPNIEKQIATWQLTFISKVARNSDGHLPTKIITAWCNHKRLRGGVMHTKNKSIVHNLRLVMPGVGKTGAL